jgi:hypothetical protein
MVTTKFRPGFKIGVYGQMEHPTTTLLKTLAEERIYTSVTKGLYFLIPLFF